MRPEFSRSSRKIHTNIPLLLAAFLLLAQPSGNAVAEDLLGLYVGGAIGQSRVEANSPQTIREGQVQVADARVLFDRTDGA